MIFPKPKMARLFALDQFEEAALPAFGGSFLVKEAKIVLLELIKPIVPGDRLERAFAGVTRKVDAKNACRVPSGSASNRGWPTAACFGPFADRVVIGRDVRRSGGAGAPARASAA